MNAPTCIPNYCQRPPGYEEFFTPLEVALNPTDLETIDFAYRVSKAGHAKQRRDDGSRFFDHPKAAAWIYINELGGRDARAITVLLLHDLREDSNLLSGYRIRLNFGEDIALDVRAVTKYERGNETTIGYLKRVVARGPYAVLSKLCDRLHNVRSLSGCTDEKRRIQLKETNDYHIPTLLPALSEHGGTWQEYAVSLDSRFQEAIAQYK